MMNGQTGHVLVVDDRPEQREIYSTMLVHAGMSVLEARDGETAMSLARAHLPDVVLLDICLPDVNGFEVARRLRADQRTSCIRIVMLTASGGPDCVPGGVAYDEFLFKPVEPREALNAVRRLLSAGNENGRAP
jgi:CheY-like chemotaxis protein